MRKTTLLVALMAFVAVPAFAFADILLDTPEPQGVGPLGDISPRSGIIVYDNTAGALFNTGTSPRSHECDDGSFSPQAVGGYHINSLHLCFLGRTAHTAI